MSFPTCLMNMPGLYYAKHDQIKELIKKNKENYKKSLKFSGFKKLAPETREKPSVSVTCPPQNEKLIQNPLRFSGSGTHIFRILDGYFYIQTRKIT